MTSSKNSLYNKYLAQKSGMRTSAQLKTCVILGDMNELIANDFVNMQLLFVHGVYILDNPRTVIYLLSKNETISSVSELIEINEDNVTPYTAYRKYIKNGRKNKAEVCQEAINSVYRKKKELPNASKLFMQKLQKFK